MRSPCGAQLPFDWRVYAVAAVEHDPSEASSVTPSNSRSTGEDCGGLTTVRGTQDPETSSKTCSPEFRLNAATPFSSTRSWTGRGCSSELNSEYSSPSVCTSCHSPDDARWNTTTRSHQSKFQSGS